MAIRLSRFEMPKRVAKEEAGATPNYARFVAEPFEVGYARTLGNSLRRVLLSSIEGVAITAVRIEGAAHEFSTLPGVREDVTDIILNLKRVLLKSYIRSPRWITLRKKGPCEITAADFESDNSIEVLNPSLPIATVGDGGEVKMEVEVCTGRGFFPAEWNKNPEQEIGYIPIDSIFSPVTRVNYMVENTRVGQRTDYEKLIIDVWTDGRVSPENALKTAAAILRHHLDVFVDYSEEIVEFEEAERKLDEERTRLRKILNMSVNEIELSVRAANCLNNANIITVGQLASKTEADMLKYRNFGKKSLNEIRSKLSELGFGLGYKFDPDLLENIGDDDEPLVSETYIDDFGDDDDDSYDDLTEETDEITEDNE